MIVPKRTTLGDLYKSNGVLEVPKYQRAFDWGKGEVFEMITDLKAAMHSEGDLFLGTFVFDTSKKDVYKIVDGQQRITSFTLLLIACRQLAKKMEYYSLAQEIQKKISFTDETTGEMLSERVHVSPSITDVFTYICDEEWNGEFPSKVNGKQVKRQSNKLQPLYAYMAEEISVFTKDELSNFLKIVYSTYVIQIDIADELEAFDIFERTNARGLSLNVADLLKNYLYQNNDEKFIEEKWEEIISHAGSLLQRMLKYFWVAKHGATTKKDLYRKLKALGSSGGAIQLTEDLFDFSLYFDAVSNAEPELIKEWFKEIDCATVRGNKGYLERVISCLRGLNHFKITQHIPLIYSITKAYKRAGETDAHTKMYLRLLCNIEKYHFINNQICDRVGNEIEKPYAEFCSAFEKSDDFLSIGNDFIALLKDKLATEQEFISRFIELDYTSLALSDTCYIFDRINNVDMSPSEWVTIFDPDKTILVNHYNTEHFLPQNPDYEVSAEDMAVVNNIGNLFIIARHTNSKLQNKPPYQKIKLLKEFGKKFRYVTNFVEDFEKTSGEWGRKEINERAQDLAKASYRIIWAIK